LIKTSSFNEKFFKISVIMLQRKETIPQKS